MRLDERRLKVAGMSKMRADFLVVRRTSVDHVFDSNVNIRAECEGNAKFCLTKFWV